MASNNRGLFLSGAPDLLHKLPEKEQLIFQNAIQDLQVDLFVAVNDEISESDHVLVCFAEPDDAKVLKLFHILGCRRQRPLVVQ